MKEFLKKMKKYMINSNKNKIELIDIDDLSKYENKNSLQLRYMLNEFFKEKYIEKFKSLVIKYNIACYTYVEVGNYDNDTCNWGSNRKTRILYVKTYIT